MRQNWWKALVLIVLAVSVAVVIAGKDRTNESKPAAKAEQVTTNKGSKPKPAANQLPKLLELGADKCVPCKAMMPIIEELEKEYEGILDVEFIDVWKNEGVAEKYGIKSIPTQIFYDENGNEFFRHQGFFAKEDILKTFEEHGIELQGE